MYNNLSYYERTENCINLFRYIDTDICIYIEKYSVNQKKSKKNLVVDEKKLWIRSGGYVEYWVGSFGSIKYIFTNNI